MEYVEDEEDDEEDDGEEESTRSGEGKRFRQWYATHMVRRCVCVSEGEKSSYCTLAEIVTMGNDNNECEMDRRTRDREMTRQWRLPISVLRTAV